MKHRHTLLPALLLAALLCASSCGEESKVDTVDSSVNTSVGTSVESTDDPKQLIDYIPTSLPREDFGGMDFKFLIWDNGTELHIYEEYDSPEENGEVLNDAIFKRNSAIEEVYNVTISTVGEQVPENRLKKDVMAGDTEYQVVTDWPTRLASASTQNYLIDL